MCYQGHFPSIASAPSERHPTMPRKMPTVPIALPTMSFRSCLFTGISLLQVLLKSVDAIEEAAVVLAQMVLVVLAVAAADDLGVEQELASELVR